MAKRTYFKLPSGFLRSFRKLNVKTPETYEEMRDESARKTCCGIDCCEGKIILPTPSGGVYHIYVDDLTENLVVENSANGESSSVAASQGIFADDAAAAAGGVIINQMYELSAGNTYGLPAGIFKRRKA